LPNSHLIFQRFSVGSNPFLTTPSSLITGTVRNFQTSKLPLNGTDTVKLEQQLQNSFPVASIAIEATSIPQASQLFTSSKLGHTAACLRKPESATFPSGEFSFGQFDQPILANQKYSYCKYNNW